MSLIDVSPSAKRICHPAHWCGGGLDSLAGDTGSEAAGLATDAFGNAYLAGSLGGRAKFGDIVLDTGGPVAPFVAKFDPEGNVVWADCGVSQFEAYGTCIAVNAHT